MSNGKEYDRIGELQKKNERLLQLIGKQQVELIYKSGLIKLAKDKLGENFEKNENSTTQLIKNKQTEYKIAMSNFYRYAGMSNNFCEL